MGCNYDCLVAPRDLATIQPPLILVPMLRWTIILPQDLEEPSQLGLEVIIVMAYTMWIALGSVLVSLVGVRFRPALVFGEPNAYWVSDETPMLLGHE